MFQRVAYLLALTLLLATPSGCTKENEDYCTKEDPSCPAGKVCNIDEKVCEPIILSDAIGAGDDSHTTDAGFDAVDAGDASADAEAGLDTNTDASPQDLEEKLTLGDECQLAEECKSGFCANGVCCNGACEGTCRSCVVDGKEGVCTNSPLNTDADGDCAKSSTECAGNCDGAGACQYPGGEKDCGDANCSTGALTTSACDGSGACEPTTVDCGGYTCMDALSCRTDCSDAAHCTGTAQCLGTECVSNLGLGSGCGTNNKACASGFCTDGVCCNTACNEDCHVCNSQGTCTAENQIPCGDPSCTGGVSLTYACDQGTCKTSSVLCDPYICAPSAVSCMTRCGGDTECIDGYCTPDGACADMKTYGQGCDGGNECASSFCTDGVCCNTACNEDCHACSSQGICTAENQVPCGAATCTSGTARTFTCNQGTCQTSAVSCEPYLCAANAVACMTSCGNDGECIGGYCTPAGACLDTKANGEDCGDGNECDSGICTAEGVCCNTTCNGDCETCYRKTQCSPENLGTACAGVHEDVCSTDLNALLTPQCDGVHHDCQNKSTDCGAFFCTVKFGDDACNTNCTQHSDCQSGLCDLHFGPLNKCVPDTSICFVGKSGCGAAGSRAQPKCTIQECLETKKLYVVVGGAGNLETYSEQLTTKANVWVFAPDSKISPNRYMVEVNPATSPALNTGGYQVVISGLSFIPSGTNAAVDAGGTGELLLEGCHVQNVGGSGVSSTGGSVEIRDSVVLENGLHGVNMLGGSLDVRRSQISKNAGTGVAAANTNALTIINSDIRSNGADGLTLGMLSTPATIAGTLIAYNDVYGLRMTAGSSNVTNCTIVYSGSTVFSTYLGQVHCGVSGINFHNSIVWDIHTSGTSYTDNAGTGALCSFSFSDVRGLGTSGTNYELYPAFIAPGRNNQNFRLNKTSPCVDRGSNNAPNVNLLTTDLDARSRIYNSTIDMGPYEYQ